MTTEEKRREVFRLETKVYLTKYNVKANFVLNECSMSECSKWIIDNIRKKYPMYPIHWRDFDNYLTYLESML